MTKDERFICNLVDKIRLDPTNETLWTLFMTLDNPWRGPFEQTETCAKHQPRCECGKPAGIIWKDDTRNSDTWFFSECASCEDPLCHDCQTQNDEDETVCITCLSEECRKEEKALEGI